MIKCADDVLKDLKAIHLLSMASNNGGEYRRGHTVALLAIAEMWGVSAELSDYISKFERSHNVKHIRVETVSDLQSGHARVQLVGAGTGAV